MVIRKPILNHIENRDFFVCIEDNEFIGSSFDSIILEKNLILEDIKIEECVFKNMSFQNVSFQHVELMDVIFENCDLSNIRFTKPITRVLFKNCKLIGAHFLSVNMKDVELENCALRFSNCFETTLTNCLLHHNDFTESYFSESLFKTVEVRDCNFTKAEFDHTSLYGMDLSTSEIYGIKTDLFSIRGVIIDSFQASALVGMLGVKIKS